MPGRELPLERREDERALWNVLDTGDVLIPMLRGCLELMRQRDEALKAFPTPEALYHHVHGDGFSGASEALCWTGREYVDAVAEALKRGQEALERVAPVGTPGA
jgi:hypothetical protein